MVEIPDPLESLFTASIEKDDDSYRIEVPQDALDLGTISAGETYRVAIFGDSQPSESQSQQEQPSAESTPTPPVDTGDVREVTIETLGDKGDGIAKIERGYVLIVPGGRPDDEVTVEVTEVRQNVAFAEVRD
ncbi:TRAM domain-containing protein [Halococcus sediminicola]|uniref:TRAM domain-containing protein n=1 Tax=Halococcus sediminicola TaxID=1264579 RepID=UPI0006789559|nr:TRAM domain-containing protein [Halococcus sediminicola]